jgi:hypothetical protein
LEGRPEPIGIPSPPLSSAPSSFASALRSLPLDHTSKLRPDADNEAKAASVASVLPPLLLAFPSHLPLLSLELRFLHELNLARPPVDRAAGHRRVADRATALLTHHIDQSDLLAHFGRLIEKDDTVGLALRKEKEEVRRTVTRVYAIRLEMELDNLRRHRNAMRSVEYSPAALKQLQGADISSLDERSFALASAAFDGLIAEAAQWIDVTTKEGNKQFGFARMAQMKLRKQYGAIWTALTAEVKLTAGAKDSADTTAPSANSARAAVERAALLHFLSRSDADGSAYAHLVAHERALCIRRAPKEFHLY